MASATCGNLRILSVSESGIKLAVGQYLSFCVTTRLGESFAPDIMLPILISAARKKQIMNEAIVQPSIVTSILAFDLLIFRSTSLKCFQLMIVPLWVYQI